MFSNHRFKRRRTLALRLTLWYAGIFTVSAGVAFLLFYLLITSVFRNYTDQELSNQKGHMATLLAKRGIEVVKRVAWLEARAAGAKKIFIRLLLKNGQVFSSSNMSYWRDIKINKQMIDRVLGGDNPVFETVRAPDQKHNVRILYGMVDPSLILQLGRSMEISSRFLEAYQKIFVATLIGLIVLAAGVGWFMARRALSGVEAVTRTARKIAGGTLTQRVPVKARGDEIDQLAITFNDMLDRIQILVAGIKEMSDNIAHDLRSPITRIRGLAEVTLTTEPSREDFSNMAASTIEECDRLLAMINTMLVISQTEAGVDRLQLEEVDLAEIVRGACELFTPMAEDKGMTLVCQPVENSLIRGDVRMVQRMLANILDNAIKYTPDGEEVRVTMREEESESGEKVAMIRVKDTGTGIAPEELPHIFERFYRCDQSRSQSGVGLGLSLSRAIARAHGGDIAVVSTEGQGSEFTVTLPKSPTEDHREPPDPKTPL